MTATGTPAARVRNRSAFVRDWSLRAAVLAIALAAGFRAGYGDMVSDIVAGEPVSYLLLVAPWAVAIARRCVHARDGHPVIADRETDWIVAGVLTIPLVVCLRLAAPRLGGVADVWHLAVVIATAAAIGYSVVIFGLRSLARAWPALLFVVWCFPAIVFSLGVALGGTPADFGRVAVGYSTVAVLMSVAGSLLMRAAWAAGTLAVGLSAVVLLEGTPAAVVQVVPAAIAFAVGWGGATATHPRDWPGRRGGVPMPPVTWRTVGVLTVFGILLAVTGNYTPSPARSAAQPGLTVADDWTSAVRVDGDALSTATASYPWAQREFGPGSESRRLWLGADGSPAAARAAVDVTDVANAGRLRSLPAGLLYQPGGVAGVGQVVRLAGRVDAVVQTSDPDQVKTPTDPSWVMVTWTWRLSGSDDVQRVTLLLSQDPSRPRLLPTLTQPSAWSITFAPLFRLIQGGPLRPPPASSEETRQEAVALATRLVDAVVHR